MVIRDLPEVAGRVELKKELNKSGRAHKKKDGALKKSVLVRETDSVDIADAALAVEKENLLASKASIEDFEHAKSILSSILDRLDERNLMEIHGNADKIKSFLIM